MARKKRSGECVHKWREWSETIAYWHGFGYGATKHRACINCSKLDWGEFQPRARSQIDDN